MAIRAAPLTQKATANHMCSGKATGFGTEFQNNDGRVGLIYSVPCFYSGIGVIYIRFHVCRSWGAGGNGVAGKRGCVCVGRGGL